MKEKDFYTLEEIEDEFIGVKGTPKRDKESYSGATG